MYARYSRTRIGNNATRYQIQEEHVSLFGCNEGYIPWLLKFKIPPAQGEPYRWHVNVVQELGSRTDYPGTLLIDLKPSDDTTNLYEVLDVWGISSSGWSRILMRLSGLFIEDDPNSINRNDFTRHDSELDSPIYSFLYLRGSVKDGDLDGKWVTAPPSSTNSALLWPEHLNYFVQCIRGCTPDILEQ